MTSRKSYSKALIITLRNHIWSIAFSCVGLFFSLPIYAALYISIIENQFSSGLFRKDVLPKLFTRSVLGEGNYIILVATTLLAIVIALNGFSYLFSKEKVDLYHSIPVKRKELFVLNYVTGFIVYAIPYIVFMLLMLIIGQSKGFITSNGIVATLITLGTNLLGFLGIYSTTVLAVMLTGNTIVSILATSVFLLYGVAIKALIQSCNGVFFDTYSNETFNSAFTRILSPLTEYWGLRSGMGSYYGIFELSANRIIVYIIFVVAIIALNLFLYTKRPSEAAGQSISFTKSCSVISVLLLIPISVAGALFFNGVVSREGNVSLGWLIFGAAFTLIISHFIIQAIFYRDFNALFKNIMNPIISAVVVTITLIIYILDLTGYDSYNPSTNSKLINVAISSYDLQGYEEYFNFDVNADEYGNKYYYEDLTEYRLKHMEIDDRELLNDFIKAAVSDTHIFRDLQRNSSDNPNIFDNTSYVEFVVKFNMANSKPIYRNYNLDLLSNMELYNRLYKNHEYKKGVFGILQASDDDITDIKFANAAGTIEADLSKEQMNTLVDTYKQELLEQGAYELATASPVGYLYQEHIVFENGYYSTYNLYKSYVYPSFTKTLALLDEYGIDVNKYLTIDNIDRIKVINYSHQIYADYDVADEIYEDEAEAKMVGTYSDEVSMEYTDLADIEAIISASAPMEMVSADYSLKKNAPLDIQVELKECPDQYMTYVSYYFLKGDVPDFIARDLEYVEH